MTDDHNQPDDGLERERADARAQIAGLVADAERLLELARRQGEELIEEARSKADDLTAELTAEAKRTLADAQRQSDALREEAERDRRRAAEILEQAPAQAAGAPAVTANEVLRIAQAEAEARARELLDETHRKIENAETEGRRRLEQMRSTYRTMQQQIRREEFAAKARILALREETEELEARIAQAKNPLGESSSAGHRPADRPETTQGSESRPGSEHESQVTPQPLPRRDPQRDPQQHPPGESTASQTLDRFTATVSDPERALRGIRRRA